ncbi:MAG: PfkB family carbohydrate kinase [Pseudonocardiaceae bacterium]
MVPRKGVETTVRAMAGVPSAELIIAGGGDATTEAERARLATIAQECGVSERVRLVGHIPRKDIPALLRGADAVLVADYGRGITAIAGLRVALAELACRVPVVWDPHPHGGRPVPGCRLITPNESEATAFASAPHGLAIGAVLRQRWRCCAVAMTMGARGALLTTSSGSLAVPVPDLAVPAGSDTCGAGDAFAAAVAGALLDDRSITEAVTVAVGAASHFVADGGVSSLDSLTSGSEVTHPVPTPPGPGARSVPDIAARVRHATGVGGWWPLVGVSTCCTPGT